MSGEEHRRRGARVLVIGIAALALFGFAAPAFAQTPSFPDTNGDGIPDIPVGEYGDWDDTVGATSLQDFITRTGADGLGFTDADSSALTGPCGGIAFSYDSEGNSIDGALDLGDDSPPVDFQGNLAFTKDNPFEVDTGGTVAYFGFTGVPFFNHHWKMTVQGIGLDSGGDDNPQAEDQNAGLVELGEILPFQFSALVKADGFIVDGTGANRCDGHGWVKFKSDANPILTPPGILAAALFAAGFSGLLFLSRPALTW